jgi:hypothetical protein
MMNNTVTTMARAGYIANIIESVDTIWTTYLYEGSIARIQIAYLVLVVLLGYIARVHTTYLHHTCMLVLFTVFPPAPEAFSELRGPIRHP